MRSVYEKLRDSRFGRKYLSDGALINFLRHVKHFGGRVYRKLKGVFPKEQHFDNLPELLETYINMERTKEDFKGNSGQDNEEIDVIIPIFNGYGYLLKLFQDLLKTQMKCRIILVDDKSTDAQVKELEKKFAMEHTNVMLLENEENLGFVKSVNRGLSVSKNHVALVNTDTELPQGWLERLMDPILHEDKVASATPYTNSGTIFSFPDFGYNNRLYKGKNVDILDSYFQKLRPRYVAVPTGVGFCMGMNRDAIAEVGVLDAETFGRGFGEENDWCQRAIKKGYRNVQVENLFVYHKHGGTFLSQEKEQLLERHMMLLKKKYPSYDHQVSTFIYKDPNKKARHVVQMLIDTHETKSVLYFDHSWGGGATRYLNVQKEKFLGESCCVSIVRYSSERNRYSFLFENGSERQEYEFELFTDLLEVGKWLHFDEIYINELVSYPGLWEVHDSILKLKEQQGARLIMLFHDFFALCPTINLLDTSQSYCGMPEEESCNNCFLQKEFDSQYNCKSRKEWVLHWKELLLGCTEVRTFSKDSRKRVADAFGDELKITLVEHEVDYMFPINKECKREDTLNIGLLGIMALHKGSGFVKQLLDEITSRKLNIKIKLIGKTDGVDFSSYTCFEETGGYEFSQLPKLVYENDIDLFLIASIWPETFSYTTEEIIKMGMPVASFDLGAPAERIRCYEKGLILESSDAAGVLEQMERFASDKLQIWDYRVNAKKVVYLVEYVSFSSRYRIEHMQEELLYQGIQGEIWETRALPKRVDWQKISTLVIYRCRYQKSLQPLLKEARKHGVSLVYDIDDYIFEFEKIRGLPFLADKEYKDFETYSGLIHQCMAECDALIVSTEHLKQAALQVFPKKRVLVNRNVASAQMLILSALALQKKRHKTDRLTLGYFSGSNTHGRDFEVLADVLLSFMEQHEEVYLKVVGCLQLPEGFNRVQERVIRIGFMDWRLLPDAIASVDINLMPLEDTFFHACKSENKWMEAALVKVATICSYNDEIAGVTHPGEDILLCRNDSEWWESLNKLRENTVLREQIAQKAFEYAVGHKTTLQKNTELLDFIWRNE